MSSETERIKELEFAIEDAISIIKNPPCPCGPATEVTLLECIQGMKAEIGAAVEILEDV